MQSVNKTNLSSSPRKASSAMRSILISLVIGMGILILGYLFYVLPGQKHAEQLSIEGPDELNADLTTKKDRLVTLQDRLETYNQLSPELLEKLDESLPTEPREVDLLVNIQALVQESDLELTAIAVDSVPSAEKTEGMTQTKEVKTLSISLNLEGLSYSHLKRFINNIESNIRLLRLNDVSYSPSNTGYGVTLNAFYYQ